jgi:hypothetical protein
VIKGSNSISGHSQLTFPPGELYEYDYATRMGEELIDIIMRHGHQAFVCIMPSFLFIWQMISFAVANFLNGTR